jgi:hypothetical protein
VNRFADENQLVQAVQAKLKAAGESEWQRYPRDTEHPGFRSCRLAALNLLRVFSAARVVLVMRDPCLRAVREQVLLGDRRLVIPSRHGDGLLEVPPEALICHTDGGQAVLRITPTPPGSLAFSADVDLVVVSCLAFDPYEKRLYTFGTQTDFIVTELSDGLASGWRLPVAIPVVCIASDQQQVTAWPSSALGLVAADLVVTATRLIALGSGEQVGLDADSEKEVKQRQEVHGSEASDDDEATADREGNNCGLSRSSRGPNDDYSATSGTTGGAGDNRKVIHSERRR